MPRGDFPPKDKLIMKDLLFRYSELPLAGFLAEAAQTKDRLIKCRICPVSAELVLRLEGMPQSIDPEYRHVMDNFSYHHIRARHSGKREILRGQIPITDNDFIRIPEIIARYDSLVLSTNKIGNDVLLYRRMFDDGILYLAEEIRRGRKELAICTLYKRKRKLTDANRPEDDADSGFVPFLPAKIANNPEETKII